MTLAKAALLSAIVLAGATSLAAAQPYPYAAAAPPTYAYAPPPAATPPSWSYDPYTSGQAPCPQGIPGDQQTCSQKMPPTYGQPNYWSR